MAQQTFNKNDGIMIMDNILGLSIEPFVIFLFGYSCNKVSEKISKNDNINQIYFKIILAKIYF